MWADIEINELSNSVDELGVGAVRIDSALDDYKRTTIKSGDTKIRGLKNEANTHRKVVSSQSLPRQRSAYH